MIAVYVEHRHRLKIEGIAFENGCQAAFQKGSGQTYEFSSVEGAVAFLFMLRGLKTRYVEIPRSLAPVLEIMYPRQHSRLYSKEV